MFDEEGNETADFEVGSDECGDELTALRSAKDEAARQMSDGRKRTVDRYEI